MSDPILDSLFEGAPEGLFGDEKPEYDGPYGLGTWPDAKLIEVTTMDRKDDRFGYRIALKFNLKGDSAPFTGRIDLPMTVEQNGDPDRYEWAKGREEKRRDVVNRILAGLGSPKTIKGNVDNDETYNAVGHIFLQLVGNTCPLKVTEDGKNVKDADGKWTFEPNGFTKIDAVRPRKKK